MRAVGLDIGSRTIKLAVVEDGRLVDARTAPTSYNPRETVHELLTGVARHAVAATGYGRHLVGDELGCAVLSEIRAFAVGARALRPGCTTILDIGGQDTKAIALNGTGEPEQFEMNDKCAAGTGRFLEVMASALGYAMEEFSRAAGAASHAEQINATCTVFAESEVISLIARGADRRDVALGVHRAIVARAVALVRRVAPGRELFFAGGVALNACMAALLREELGTSVFVPEQPQIVGALGAALHALKAPRAELSVGGHR